jgi:hypothetical protein
MGTKILKRRSVLRYSLLVKAKCRPTYGTFLSCVNLSSRNSGYKDMLDGQMSVGIMLNVNVQCQGQAIKTLKMQSSARDLPKTMC